MKPVIQTQCINLFRWPGASCQGYFLNPSFVRCFKCPTKLFSGVSALPLNLEKKGHEKTDSWNTTDTQAYHLSSIKECNVSGRMGGKCKFTHTSTRNYHIKIASHAFWLPFTNFCRLCMLVCFLGESVLGIFSGGRKWEMIRFLLWRRTNRLPL